LQRKSAIAAALAFYEAYGQGWRSYRLYGDNIMKITAADVARAARKYLDPQREVAALVEPPAQTPGAARAAARSGGSVTGSHGRSAEAVPGGQLRHDPDVRSPPR
jgi:threonine dehydratase